MLVVNGREYSIDGNLESESNAAAKVMAELRMIVDFKSECLECLATHLLEIESALTELQSIAGRRDFLETRTDGSVALSAIVLNRLREVVRTAERDAKKSNAEILKERQEELEAAL